MVPTSSLSVLSDTGSETLERLVIQGREPLSCAS